MLLPSAAFSTSSAAASPSHQHAAQADPAALRNFSQLRKEFGLTSNLNFVRTVKSAPSPILGIPLTSAEESEMLRRGRLGRAVSRINDQMHASKMYGGAWLDQSGGGVLRVSFVNGVSSGYVQRVGALLDVGQAAQYSKALNSLEKMEDTVAQITASYMTQGGDSYSPDVLGAGIDVADDTVQISISSVAPTWLAPLLVAKFGASVVAVHR